MTDKKSTPDKLKRFLETGKDLKIKHAPKPKPVNQTGA
jgi:hypothetical protein